MAGRPPSPGQSAAQRAHAEAERERYSSLSPTAKRTLVQTRDREAQQAADARRRERQPTRHRAYQNGKSDPQKTKARATVALALSTGKLTKPAACQRCGAKSALEAHHPDHSKPMAVKWYCATCHGKTQQAGSVEQHPHGQKGPVA